MVGSLSGVVVVGGSSGFWSSCGGGRLALLAGVCRGLLRFLPNRRRLCNFRICSFFRLSVGEVVYAVGVDVEGGWRG